MNREFFGQIIGLIMLIKSIIATVIGASVTGGAVYVAQNPGALEPVQAAVKASTEDVKAKVIKPIIKPTLTDKTDPLEGEAHAKGTAKVQPSSVSSESTRPEKTPKQDVAVESPLPMTTDDLLAQIDRDAETRLNYDAGTRTAILDCLRAYMPSEAEEPSDYDAVAARAELVACADRAKLGETEAQAPVSERAARGERRVNRDNYRTRDRRGDRLRDETPNVSEMPSLPEASFIDGVMIHAEKIQSLELRDQAYLDIVDYALLREDFSDAERSMKEINDMALRDTARNRIAIKYALSGESDMAFDLIDTVENVSLRDYMRLQVIEALVVPDRLPQGVVPR